MPILCKHLLQLVKMDLRLHSRNKSSPDLLEPAQWHERRAKVTACVLSTAPGSLIHHDAGITNGGTEDRALRHLLLGC